MKVWQAVKCFVGFHDWRIAKEVNVPSSGHEDGPVGYRCGGVDYHIWCAHCPAFYVDQKRGVWIKPKFPAYLTLTKG